MRQLTFTGSFLSSGRSVSEISSKWLESNASLQPSSSNSELTTLVTFSALSPLQYTKSPNTTCLVPAMGLNNRKITHAYSQIAGIKFGLDHNSNTPIIYFVLTVTEMTSYHIFALSY